MAFVSRIADKVEKQLIRSATWIFVGLQPKKIRSNIGDSFNVHELKSLCTKNW